jgi:protein-S-isoprenylcysteine O-methyltransferase Ste14
VPVEELALVCWSLFGLFALAVRVALQIRRTGSSGFKVPSGGPMSADWTAGAGLVAAVACGVAAPLLAQSGDVEPIGALDRTGVHVLGIALFALGLSSVVATQQAMGRSWRIGVDPGERTGLVTGGPFRLVRNPIFTGMVITWAGLAAMVPSVVALASVALLIASLEVQTRLVEERYLLRKHGEDYAAYAGRVGRFLPGIGRLG